MGAGLVLGGLVVAGSLGCVVVNLRVISEWMETWMYG